MCCDRKIFSVAAGPKNALGSGFREIGQSLSKRTVYSRNWLTNRHNHCKWTKCETGVILFWKSFTHFTVAFSNFQPKIDRAGGKTQRLAKNRIVIKQIGWDGFNIATNLVEFFFLKRKSHVWKGKEYIRTTIKWTTYAQGQKSFQKFTFYCVRFQKYERFLNFKSNK